MDPSLTQLAVGAMSGVVMAAGGYWTYLTRTKERRENAAQSDKERLEAAIQAGYDQRVMDLKEHHERERQAWDRERQDLQQRLAQTTLLAAQHTTALEESNLNDRTMAGLVDRLLTILEPGGR